MAMAVDMFRRKLSQGDQVHAQRRFTEMCSGSEAGSYLRLIDFCITEL